ncbi:MAG: crossover junction endodeoxyribonuclease RuvC [Spirochaetes bacterium]|nr:crossover junction endodeoxyribonuclease RuvC [Spirochaetota bacterium]
MKIIGIDPGYGILGWSVIEDSIKLYDYGTIETPPGMPIDERLFIIYTELNSILQKYQPDSAAIEKLFFAKNTNTVMDVMKAIGVVLLLFRIYGVPFREYTPLQIKQALTGYGRADKKQMQFVIQKIFNLKECPKPDDAADAAAIAACHALAGDKLFMRR